jgi:tetratricopeptide (TPR) repeat protein
MSDEFRRERAMELWNEGLLQQQHGALDLAVQLYTKSIELCPTAEAYTYRGWAYHGLGRIEDAIAECMRAIEVDPSFGNPYNDIGAYLIEKEDFDGAIEWLEKAKRAPRYEPRHFPYMNLGRVYAAKGMVLRAIEEFERALEIAPGEPNCVSVLTQLRAALN